MTDTPDQTPVQEFRINRLNEAIAIAENIAVAPPRSRVEIDHFARALTSLPQTDAVAELSDALEVFQPTDVPDAHMVGLAGLRSAARDALHEMDHHALCVHDLPISQRPEWATSQTASSDRAVRSVDWSAQTADDPAGYQKLRRFLADVADSFDGLERPATAAALRAWATTTAGSPSELLGESALVMRRELMQRHVGGPLREELEKCVAAIRQGFLRTGTPNF